MSSQTAAKQQAAAPPAQPGRMTLSSIQKGKRKAPLRLVVYGVDGVGKTTFAASAPSPVFLGTEDGSEHLDVARFPMPQTWEELLEAVRALTDGESTYQTLVVDSLDWAEPLLWRHIIQKANVGAKEPVESIEEVGGGYGKGYSAAVDGWRVFVAALERLQRDRKMNVILIGHASVKTWKNPEGEDFDRYVLKLHEKSAALLREWASGVYFANFETFANKDTKTKRVRGVSTGSRLLYTLRTGAYDAKDRYGVPEQLPLSWSEFVAAVERGQPADPAALRSEIQRKAKLLGSEMEKATLESLERVGGDALRLSQLNSWLNAKVAEKAEKERTP